MGTSEPPPSCGPAVTWAVPVFSLFPIYIVSPEITVRLHLEVNKYGLLTQAPVSSFGWG